MLTAFQAYEFGLLILCIWREARSESLDGQHAVGWVIKNRVAKGGWFGKSYSQVILKPSQFSSFNPKDPNAAKFPIPETDAAYSNCVLAAKHVYEGTAPDNTDGSTYYFDQSLNENPPSWAKGFIKTVTIGRLNFFKEA